MKSVSLGLLSTLVAGLVANAAQAAPIVVVDGALRGASASTFAVGDASVEVIDEAGTVLVSSDVAGLTINDGLFSFDLDLADAAAALEAGDTLTTRITLRLADDRELEVVGALGRPFSALQADRADRATSAATATRLGTLEASALLNVVDLGNQAVTFSNIIDPPPGIEDGDQGNVDTIGSGLALSGGVLNVANGGVSTTNLVDGSVTGAQIADGSVTGTDLAALPNTVLADATLTGANFADNAFAAGDVLGTRTVGRLPNGCANAGALTVGFSCPTIACANQPSFFRECDGTCNGRTQATFCLLDFLGELIVDP